MKSLFFASLLHLSAVVYGQAGYERGNTVKDFSLNKILNYPASPSSFDKIKKDLLIIDFFGTWCVPCIKALPHLAEVQQKYKSRIQVLLVSVEEEEKLKKFIANRANFLFPVVVDNDNAVTSLFQPPSYPYTVVQVTTHKRGQHRICF